MHHFRITSAKFFHCHHLAHWAMPKTIINHKNAHVCLVLKTVYQFKSFYEFQAKLIFATRSQEDKCQVSNLTATWWDQVASFAAGKKFASLEATTNRLNRADTAATCVNLFLKKFTCQLSAFYILYFFWFWIMKYKKTNPNFVMGII